MSDYVFSGCPIQTIDLPSTLKTIGKACFEETALTELRIPDSVTEIGERAFMDCQQLVSILLPSHLHALGAGAFSYTGLTQIDIPGTVAVLPDRCFFNCEQLTSVTLHEGLEVLGKSVFEHCPFQTVTFPSTLKTLGEESFSNTGLSDFIIPKNVSSIGKEAFNNCSDLVKVDILAPLDTLDKAIFSRCYKLKSVTVHFPKGKAIHYPEDGLFRVVYD